MIVQFSRIISSKSTIWLFILGFVSFLITLPEASYSQKNSDLVTSSFETYHAELAPEKVYLNTNRERFALGDTLYFSAFVVEGMVPPILKFNDLEDYTYQIHFSAGSKAISILMNSTCAEFFRWSSINLWTNYQSRD